MRNYLIIDDDALVRESIKLMLEGLDCNIDLAQDGAEGIELFKTNKYDLVITDIIMPQQEGFETITQIKKLDDNANIIAISGGSRNGIGSYLPIAKDLGAKAILYKPFDNEELIDTITQVCS